MKHLSQQALHLHLKLSIACHAEAARRDEHFKPCSDPVRLARLLYLKGKAADRWRRRMAKAERKEH